MEPRLDYQSTETRKIYDLRSTYIPGALLLGHYTYQEAGEVLARHRHTDMFEICFLDKGKQVYEIESEEYHLKGGDLLLTKPDQIHGTSNYPESVGSLYWLILKTPHKSRSLFGLPDYQSAILYNDLLNAPHIHFPGNKLIKQHFRNLENYCKTKSNPLNEIHILNLLLSIVLEVVELSKVNYERGMPRDIERVRKYITENIHEQLFIDELSEITGLSQSRFKHKFRQHMGRSPIDFINSKKVERAKEKIPKAASMKEIGYQMGYSSPAYFSHVFKKYTGMTPLQYKKSISK